MKNQERSAEMIPLAKHLPVPEFYDPKNAADWGYDPDMQNLIKEAEQWKRQYAISAAASDKFKIHLLMIDMQRDFGLKKGTLYVGGRSGNGAIEDSQRTAKFIYRELPNIYKITRTMDAHFLYHIFFSTFWLDRNGSMIQPNRWILLDDIKQGEVRPDPVMADWLCKGDYAWLCQEVQHYAEALEQAKKYRLFVWPPHCIIGSTGQAMIGVVQEACMFHGYARGMQVWNEIKGTAVLTENYSIFGAEVEKTFDGIRLSQKNTRLFKTLWEADAVGILGQAASHCVKSSIDDFLALILAYDRKLAEKVYIITDCMSSVVIPGGPDFTEETEAAFERFADAGMHLVKSTDPIESWPDLKKAA